jgi:PAS domain S-box-containing protein
MASLRFESDERLALFTAARQHGVALEERSAAERSEWTRSRKEAQDNSQQLQREIDGLRQSLVAAGEESLRQGQAHQEERADFDRARTALENELARQRAEHGELQQTLADTRISADANLARVANDRAVERAAFEATIAERDAELEALAAAKRKANETAAAALADFEQRIRVAAENHRMNHLTIAQLESTVTRVSRELEVMRRDRDALSVRAAERVETLETRIAAIEVESRRHFGDMPVAMCRCSVNGAVTQANHALARLLGYTRPGDLQKLDLSESVFDSGDELRWIVDRCLTSRATQSIDTTWKKRNGSRIIVRLMAVPVAADLVDLVAEDATRIRALEEKLRNAQRMESVARYGSEVAVTCHTLLQHVKQEGQRWLARMESDTVRYQGELLFDDVTRAAGFLQQFAAYGDEQKNAPELVDVNTLLRDLGPVLKRVAGDHIDLVLSQPRMHLNLDVEARRVERMLVNVAAYSRERMPLGGRLMIDVQSVVVNREFVAKYPNVRPGAHVLLTVSEERSIPHPRVLEAGGTSLAGRHDSPQSTENRGVDLGTLQALVSDCGGHLWIMAEPSGNMVLKIHVPRRALDRAEPALPLVRPRWIQRAFGARH